MKLQISENKKIDIDNTSGIHYTLSLGEETPFGNNYLVAKIFEEKKLSNLLQSYKDDEIEFILFHDVFFIYFERDNYCFYAHFPEKYIEQIKNTNQIVFIIKEDEVEYFLAYDKIFR